MIFYFWWWNSIVLVFRVIALMTLADHYHNAICTVVTPFYWLIRVVVDS